MKWHLPAFSMCLVAQSVVFTSNAQASQIFAPEISVENDIEAHPTSSGTLDHNTFFTTAGTHSDSFGGSEISGTVNLATPKVYASSSSSIVSGYSSVGGVSYADLRYKVRFAGVAGQIAVHVAGRAYAYAANAASDVDAFIKFNSDSYSISSSNYAVGDKENMYGVEQDTGTGILLNTQFSNAFLFTTNTWYDVWIDAAAFSSADANGIISSHSYAYADPYFALEGPLASQYAIELSDGVGNAPINLSAVPLPASAPMFGAALLALAGLGYGVKRKTKVAA